MCRHTHPKAAHLLLAATQTKANQDNPEASQRQTNHQDVLLQKIVWLHCSCYTVVASGRSTFTFCVGRRSGPKGPLIVLSAPCHAIAYTGCSSQVDALPWAEMNPGLVEGWPANPVLLKALGSCLLEGLAGQPRAFKGVLRPIPGWAYLARAHLIGLR